jgi:hypothetical protein
MTSETPLNPPPQDNLMNFDHVTEDSTARDRFTWKEGDVVWLDSAPAEKPDPDKKKKKLLFMGKPSQK